MKRIKLYSIVFSTLVLGGCADQREPPMSNPAESLPNQMVPLDASAEDYVVNELRENEPGCQGGLQTDAEGRLQVCCTKVTKAEDFTEFTLDEVKKCEAGFTLAEASCTVATADGEKEGALWGCQGVVTSLEAATPAPMDDILYSASDARVVVTSGVSDLKKIHSVATFLGGLPRELYLDIQGEIVGSTYPACNFFVITSLCKAGYCTREKPFYLAAQFDDYFFREGWRLVDLEGLKKLFKDRAVFDSVLQKDNPVEGRPGHIVVPIGLDANYDVVIAQGNLGTVTNEIKRVSDSYITAWQGGFNIFVKD